MVERILQGILDGATPGSGVNATDHNVRMDVVEAGALIKVNRKGLPIGSPEEIDPVDEDSRLVQAKVGERKGLPDAISFRDSIGVHHPDIESAAMSPGSHRLIEIG